ncbi:hypothetical protein AB0M46_13845 [Dactylosporangium sp. NPDC051485]|uniref:hypothetical protein n=1 Tax=Dactylosporangium sp. NPDC051485 TaxID=3154846 RepID=UPI003432E3B4
MPAPPAGTTPQGMLLDIAQNAQSTASDRQPGTASCLHLTRWDHSPGDQVIETDSIRHVNPDGSGLLLQQTTSFQPTPPAVTLFAAGELRSPLGEPIPTDAVRLSNAITAVTPPGSGSTAVVAVLLDLTSIRTLDLAERVTVVRVLAMQPSVTYLGRIPGRDGGTGHAFRFDDSSSDPIDVYLDPHTGDILGYRLGGRTALQPSTTTLILRRTRCDCPPLPRIRFVGAVLLINIPPSANCATPPGVPTFYPADTQRGTRA